MSASIASGGSIAMAVAMVLAGASDSGIHGSG